MTFACHYNDLINSVFSCNCAAVVSKLSLFFLRQVRSYVSNEQLQDALQRHVDWLSYRADIVRQSLAGSSRSHAHRLLVWNGDVIGHLPEMTSQTARTAICRL